MKRLFAKLLIGTLMFSFAFGAVFTVAVRHAEAGSTVGAVAGVAAGASETKGCIKTMGGLVPYGVNINACVAVVANMVMWLSARTLWLSGILLNYALGYTLNMHDLLEQIPVVDIGWKVMRDISNIVFIFITLWCGISITLGIGDNGSKAWGLIAHMVLVALFINFSLFVTKAVIDASNIAALHFYNLITPEDSRKNWDGGLSEAFMNGLRLQTLYDSKSLGTAGVQLTGVGGLNDYDGTGAKGGALNFVNIILLGVFGSILMVVAAFVFFSAAIMFIIRAVTLVMLMVLSPLAFVAWIIPGASSLASAWWHKLWTQSFFAPLYLALAYVVVATINSPAFTGLTSVSGSSDKFAAALTSDSPQFGGIIFSFLILIGLMIGCLIVAQSLGAKGADTMMAWGGKLGGGALRGLGGATLRGAIRAPSNLIQGAGNLGKGVGNFGKWMASSRLLNNRFMKDSATTKFMTGLGEAGDKLHGSKAMQTVRKVTDKGKWLDPRYMEEELGKTAIGKSYVGEALRSVTTGYAANLKIGNKSMQESYEEDLHRDSAESAIGERDKAVEGADEAAEAREKLASSKGEESRLRAIQKRGGTAGAAAGATAIIAELDAKTATGATLTDKEKKLYETAKKQQAASPADFEKTLKEAGDAARAWEKKLTDAKGKISEALGKISTEEFIHLMPRELFKNRELMSMNVLGEEKYNALMEDEHFSEHEKEQYSEAAIADIEEETHAYDHEYDVWQEQQMEYTNKLKDRKRLEEEVEAEVTVFVQTHGLDRALEQADFDVNEQMAEVKRAEETLATARPGADKDAARQLLAGAQAELTTRETNRGHIITAIGDERTSIGKSKGLLNAAGEEIPLEPPRAPDWKDKDVYRSLRNIRNVRVLENIARFTPKLLDEGRFVATLSQGMIDRFRESSKVGSSQKNKVRANKSWYMGETNDMILGMDPNKIGTLEREVESAAKSGNETLRAQKAAELAGEQKLREALNKQISENYEEFKNQLDFKVKLDMNGKIVTDGVDVGGKRKLQHETGERLMPEMFGHKSDDEIQKMPGMYRTLYGVRKHMGRGATSKFADRDEGDDKRPLAQFMLDQLEQAIKGQGEVTEQNIESLKWMINDRSGRNFANFGLLEERQKKMMEIAKALYGTTKDSLHSSLSKKEALDELAKIRRSALSAEDLKNLRIPA